jgi:hypothetical protein
MRCWGNWVTDGIGAESLPRRCQSENRTCPRRDCIVRNPEHPYRCLCAFGP